LGSDLSSRVLDADSADQAAEHNQSAADNDRDAKGRERGLAGSYRDGDRLARWHAGDRRPAEGQLLGFGDGRLPGWGETLARQMLIER
jgi:hypothetical protein